MEKMFYSLEEAAAKLGKSAEQVREMAKSGQLQEFRDRDKLMFKKEQVDLLSGGGDEVDIIPLAESGELEPISLASSSGTGVAIRDDKESTGISIFEAEETDDSDPSAVTRVSNAPTGMVDPGEDSNSASGSGGLLDMTREGDDTSLGGNLLEDVYGSETIAQQTAVDAPAGDAGALFESPTGDPGETATTGAAGPMMVMAEVYDGAGSGLVGGLSLGMIVAVGLAAFAIIMGMTSTAGGGILAWMGENFWMVVGIGGGVTVIAAVLGWVLGKRS